MITNSDIYFTTFKSILVLSIGKNLTIKMETVKSTCTLKLCFIFHLHNFVLVLMFLLIYFYK